MTLNRFTGVMLPVKHKTVCDYSIPSTPDIISFGRALIGG
jgi:hypothetical protein